MLAPRLLTAGSLWQMTEKKKKQPKTTGAGSTSENGASELYSNMGRDGTVAEGLGLSAHKVVWVDQSHGRNSHRDWALNPFPSFLPLAY